jgi:hypothetical protein
MQRVLGQFYLSYKSREPEEKLPETTTTTTGVATSCMVVPRSSLAMIRDTTRLPNSSYAYVPVV